MLVPLVLRDNLVLTVLQVTRVPMVLKVSLVFRDQWDQLDLMVLQGL